MHDRALSSTEKTHPRRKLDLAAVLDQLRKHPRGMTASAVNQALGWRRGARAALQRLQQQGRAYERGGLWSFVPGSARREVSASSVGA